MSGYPVTKCHYLPAPIRASLLWLAIGLFTLGTATDNPFMMLASAVLCAVAVVT